MVSDDGKLVICQNVAGGSFIIDYFLLLLIMQDHLGYKLRPMLLTSGFLK